MKITKKSHGSQKVSLASYLGLLDLDLFQVKQPVNVPAVIENKMFMFSVERIIATHVRHANMSATEISNGVKLMLEILGTTGSFQSLETTDKGVPTLVMGPELKNQIISQFTSESNLSDSVADFILDTIVDGIQRTFRTQLSNIAIRTRLAELEDSNLDYALDKFEFEDIKTTLDFAHSIYASFQRESDITTSITKLRDYTNNPVIKDILHLQSLLFDNDEVSVNVTAGSLTRHLVDYLGVNQTTLRTDRKVGFLKKIDIQKDFLRDVDEIGFTHLAGFVLELMQVWHKGQIFPKALSNVYERRRSQMFSMFDTVLTEDAALDFNALRPFFSTEKKMDQLHHLFVSIYTRLLISNLLSRNFGSFEVQLNSIMDQRRRGIDQTFEPAFNRYVKAISLARQTYADTFSFIRGLLSNDSIFFFDVTPKIREKMVSVLQTFINSWGTFYNSVEEVRFNRALAHLVNTAPVHSYSSLSGSGDVNRNIGYAYTDEQLRYDGSQWINQIESGERRLHVVNRIVRNRDGYQSSHILQAPVDNVRPLLSKFSCLMSPIHYSVFPYDEAINDFPVYRQEATLWSFKTLAATGLLNFLMSQADEVKIYESISEMSRQLQMPKDWVEIFLKNTKSTIADPWVTLKQPIDVIVYGEGFEFLEVGRTDLQDPRLWPFVAESPYYVEWQDDTYVLSTELINSAISIPGLSNAVKESKEVPGDVDVSKVDPSVVAHFDEQAGNYLPEDAAPKNDLANEIVENIPTDSSTDEVSE